MPSGSKTVVTQCSLKDKRRRLVRQHATEEDNDVLVETGLSEGNAREFKVIRVGEQEEKVQFDPTPPGDKLADTRWMRDKDVGTFPLCNENNPSKTQPSCNNFIPETEQKKNQNICEEESNHRPSNPADTHVGTLVKNHESKNQSIAMLFYSHASQGNASASVTQKSNNKTGNQHSAHVTKPESNHRTSKRHRSSRPDYHHASGSVAIRTSNLNTESVLKVESMSHRTSNQTRERTRRTSIQTNGSIPMLNSNQRSSKESLLTPDGKNRTHNSRRGSNFLTDGNIRTQQLDSKPRTRNSSRGNIFGPEENFVLCDQTSDVLSVSSYQRRTQNSSRGSIYNLDESARAFESEAVPESGRMTCSTSRESVFTPKIRRQSDENRWKRNSSCGSISTSILSISGKTNSLDITGKREIWELNPKLSNPSASPSNQPNHPCQLLSGDTLDKGQHCQHCQHCCLIQ